MNTKITQAKHPRKSQQLKLVSLQKRAQVRKHYIAQMPRWRHPLVGYLITIPIVGLAILAVLVGEHFTTYFYFPGVPMILAIVLIALIWGLGPALFAVLLSTLALAYFYLSQFGPLILYSQNGAMQFLPFIIAGLIIAIITGQREAARMHALLAEQEAQDRADELERANQELEQANREKDQFLSMASHELKTPITTIRGLAQITLRRLSRQADMPEELADIRSMLEKIDQQTYRLNGLVEDLLALSSIRSGKMPFESSCCDLRDICRDVAESQHFLTGRTIELDLPSTPVRLEVDKDRLSQVVTNLVSNAIKYSPEESAVQVRLLQLDKVVRIEVHDSGQGIPRKDQEHIFDAFYRASNVKTARKSGWGLGLAICKNIVERHGGHIWCESEPGKGSIFFVDLPLK